MKKILIAAAAFAALTGASGAASAQSYYNGARPGFDRYDRVQGGGSYINQQQRQIRNDIQRGVRYGRITPREAQSLEWELRDISRMEKQFRNSRGLDRRELAILDNRLNRVERRVVMEARDGQRYGYGYGDRRW